MKATHYIEQFRGKNHNRVTNTPLKEIHLLPGSLTLTRQSNCITIAVFKIRFKDSYEDIPESVGGGYKQTLPGTDIPFN